MPGSRVPVLASMPRAQAGLAVIQRRAWSSLTGMPARRPACLALAASWFRRWIPTALSEWMIARAPAWVSRAAFSRMPSKDSALKPHQSAHTDAAVPAAASLSAIL